MVTEIKELDRRVNFLEDILSGTREGAPIQIQLDKIESRFNERNRREPEDAIVRSYCIMGVYINRGTPIGLDSNTKKGYKWNATHPINEYQGIAEDATDANDRVSCVKSGRYDFDNIDISVDKNIYINKAGQVTQTQSTQAIRIGVGAGEGMAMLSEPIGLAPIVVSSIKLADTDDSNYLALKWNENDTADRIFNLKVNAGDRSLTLESDSILDQDYTYDSVVRFGGLGVGTGTTAPTKMVEVSGESISIATSPLIRLNMRSEANAAAVAGVQMGLAGSFKASITWHGANHVADAWRADILSLVSNTDIGFGSDYGAGYTEWMRIKNAGGIEYYTTIQMIGRKGIRFYESDGTHYTSIKAADTIAADVGWVLPDADATAANQAIISDAAGNLGWSQAIGAGDQIIFAQLTATTILVDHIQEKTGAHNVVFGNAIDLADNDLIIGDSGDIYLHTNGTEFELYQNAAEAISITDAQIKFIKGNTNFILNSVSANIQNNAANTLFFAKCYSDTLIHSNFWYSRKSHSDTPGALVETLDTELMGRFYFQGVNSASGWDLGAQITVVQDGASGAGQVPAKLVFETSTNVGLNTNAMVLTSSGNLELANILLVDHIAELTGAHNIVFDNRIMVLADTDAYSEIGRARIGYYNLADYAGFGHRDLSANTDYALVQNAAGATLLNSASGQILFFAIANSPKMQMNATDLTLSNGVGLNIYEDITFLGATTQNLIKFPDNLAVALRFAEGANAYMDFISTDGLEAIKLYKTTIVGSGTKHDGWVTTDAAEVQTTDATVTTLTSLTLLDENTYVIQAHIVGVKSDGSQRAGYCIAGTFYRTGAGNATIGGQTSLHSYESDSDWDATFTVNGNDVRVSVTGKVGDTVEWGCTISYMNMSN